MSRTNSRNSRTCTALHHRQMARSVTSSGVDQYKTKMIPMITLPGGIRQVQHRQPGAPRWAGQRAAARQPGPGWPPGPREVDLPPSTGRKPGQAQPAGEDAEELRFWTGSHAAQFTRPFVAADQDSGVGQMGDGEINRNAKAGNRKDEGRNPQPGRSRIGRSLPRPPRCRRGGAPAVSVTNALPVPPLRLDAEAGCLGRSLTARGSALPRYRQEAPSWPPILVSHRGSSNVIRRINTRSAMSVAHGLHAHHIGLNCSDRRVRGADPPEVAMLPGWPLVSLQIAAVIMLPRRRYPCRRRSTGHASRRPPGPRLRWARSDGRYCAIGTRYRLPTSTERYRAPEYLANSAVCCWSAAAGRHAGGACWGRLWRTTPPAAKLRYLLV